MPSKLFSDPYSTIVNDRNGELLGAKIAEDGQWRFPPIDSVPKHFQNAIVRFEDKRFFKHLGMDFLAFGRAMVSNIRAGKVVSGGSTLSMQVIRLSRKGKPRSIWQKLIEVSLAFRLECSFSKQEILNLYASHAPFGGNVVGLETASWRYFKKPPSRLSISEAALLAVLPNAPSLIHLSKNRSKLKEKRNRLLLKMKEEGIISDDLYELSLLEPIPDAPHPLPSEAPHLIQYLDSQVFHSNRKSTLDASIQHSLVEIGNYYLNLYEQSDIHNLSILVLDTESGNVLGYLGNAPNTRHENAVDMIQAKRSSGSVLKPFLYAHLLDEGKIMPKTLLKDVPTQIQGFSPMNYNKKYSGASPADQALAMSLNVPAVYSLQTYGVEPFIDRLQNLGLHSIDKSADHYGLSLILGGAEVSLWELCGAYASMARILIKYVGNNGRYALEDVHPPRVFEHPESKSNLYKPSHLSAGAIYRTFIAMQKVLRPTEEGNWEQFESAKPLAWKTGTSYGHRDAWAVGVSPNYTIGIWVGNADGEGKNGLVGVKMAGPILFDVLNRLRGDGFFKEPLDDLIGIPTCALSGHLASQNCEKIDTTYSVPQSQKSPVCPYHRLIHLDMEGYQVTSRCYSPSQMIHKGWFELPPDMAHYYRQSHPEYARMPSFRTNCIHDASEELMTFLYPTETSKIYLPIDIDGIREGAIFKATHQNPHATLFWHLDEEYLGSTKDFHSMKITASGGMHRVVILDELGNRITRNFEVLQ